MKIIFLSNYFNHHQKPLCDSLYEKTKGSFVFIATAEMRQERKKLGYEIEDTPSYVKKSFESAEDSKFCQGLINEAEIVIVGSAPEKLLRTRKKENKLIYRYQERLFKKQWTCLQKIRRIPRLYLNNPRKNAIYLLCASAYTAADYDRIGLFRGKSYCWGYFPELKKHDINRLFSRKDPKKLLWCGRFIDWKHPEVALDIAQKLKQDKISFSLDMIGSGELEDDIKAQIETRGLSQEVHLLGSMKPEQVRLHMEEAGIYLFTSNRQEGWGAVLNEAMNSGCAVVANREIGSVPFLLHHENNGMIYSSEKVDELYCYVVQLLKNPVKQRELGEAAYHKIANEWNGEVAAKRLLTLSEQLLSGEKHPDLYQSGPCKKDKTVKES